MRLVCFLHFSAFSFWRAFRLVVYPFGASGFRFLFRRLSATRVSRLLFGWPHQTGADLVVRSIFRFIVCCRDVILEVIMFNFRWDCSFCAW